MNSSLARSYEWDRVRERFLANHYSNPLFSREETSAPVIKIRLNAGNNTNRIVQLVRTTVPSTPTSKKIDSPAIRGLIKTISNFGHLEENWDGYDGVAPDASTIIDAINLIKKIPEDSLPMRAGISSDGEISLIWDTNTLFADFGVIGDGTFCFFIKQNEKKLYGDDIQLDEGIPQEALKILKK